MSEPSPSSPYASRYSFSTRNAKELRLPRFPVPHGSRKRPLGGEFALEHFEPLLFSPLRKIGLRVASRLQQLFYSSVMKSAVLPNIEDCEMKAKV